MIMKHFIILVLCLSVVIGVHAQNPQYPGSDPYMYSGVHAGFKFGAGMAANNNYDVAPCAEYEMYYPVHHSFDIGFMVQYQEYSLYYQNISPYAPFSPGYQGVTLRDKADYVFLTPEINIPIPSRKIPYILNAYITAGVGYLLNGSETYHRWSYANNYPYNTNPSYDTATNTSANINNLVFRWGFGFTQHTPVYNHFRYFTLTEDFTFTGNLTGTAAANYSGRTAYSPNGLSAVYISLKIGYSFFRVRGH